MIVVDENGYDTTMVKKDIDLSLRYCSRMRNMT